MKTSPLLAGLALCALASAQTDIQVAIPTPGQALGVTDTLGLSRQTSIEDQTGIAVTVYNNNLALVRDSRSVKLLPGEQALHFMDVAEQIKPQTVSLRSVTDPGTLRILEQNFEFDLMSPDKLMEKYVGKDVRLVNKSADYTFNEQAAKLLSINGGPVYQVEGDIYLGHPGSVVLPELPEELIAKPSLIWTLENGGTDHDIEVTYLTNGISWSADYVATYREAEGKIDLEGWVTLNNQSGATYRDAELKVVAGEVNIAQDAMGAAKFEMAAAAPAMMRSADMQQESFGEYHLYTLPRRTTIKQNQSKQVSLLAAADVGVTKSYEFRGEAYYYSQQMPQIPTQNAKTYLSFQNEEENQMGMPLPGGVMRVYQADSSGALQFSGEDRIEHTAENEKVQLYLGEAFDVVGDRKQTDWSDLGSNAYESEFEISIRNRKETAITVDVVEPMPGDWTILSSTVEHTKADAFSAVFKLEVPADSEQILKYRVRVRY